ncbi:MAG: hypothetical protein Kow0074_14720 [Candidatus Zixiibacteriota bacterium]
MNDALHVGRIDSPVPAHSRPIPPYKRNTLSPRINTKPQRVPVTVTRDPHEAEQVKEYY